VAGPSPSPTPAAQLTVKQARAAYLRIADPVNRAIDAVNTDATDNVPFRQFRHDLLAYIAALNGADHLLRALRWPARVQGYITSMVLTYDPANRKCARQEAAAGNNEAAVVASRSTEACKAAQDASDPQEIRSLLDLPPMQS